MEQVDERPPSSTPPLASAIQTPFLEKHFISNQHSIATTACSHNTPSNLHQSFCRGKLDKLRETAQSVITDGKKRGFCFHAFVFDACSASSIMAGWWEVEGGEDFLHSFPAMGGPGRTRLARHVPQLPPCVRQAERWGEEEWEEEKRVR